MQKVRTLTKEDKALVSLDLLNAGIKARIKMFKNHFRIVFKGDWMSVAIVLNEGGYLFSDGSPFTSTAQFNDIDPNHGEVFVRFAK